MNTLKLLLYIWFVLYMLNPFLVFVLVGTMLGGDLDAVLLSLLAAGVWWKLWQMLRGRCYQTDSEAMQSLALRK